MAREIRKNEVTNSMISAGELAMRGASEKAQLYYHATDPLKVFEYDEYDLESKLYGYDGCMGFKSGLTFDDLVEEFEGFADGMIMGEEYEDPEGTFEVIAIDGDDVTVRCTQEGHSWEGKEFGVPFAEAWHYVING